MKKVIKEIIYYEIGIKEIQSKKKHFIEYGIGSIISLFIFVISLIFIFVFSKKDIAYLFELICVISVLIALPATLMFIFWTPSDVEIGKLNDNGVVFQIIEGKEIVEYDFDIKEIKDIRVEEEKRKELIINITDGRSFVLHNIRNVEKIVKTYYVIKDYCGSSCKKADNAKL